MKLYVLAIVLIALVACGAPSVSQDEYDTLRRDFRQSTVDMNELRTQLSDSQDEVDVLKAEVRDLQNSLMSREQSTEKVKAPAQVRNEPLFAPGQATGLVKERMRADLDFAGYTWSNDSQYVLMEDGVESPNICSPLISFVMNLLPKEYPSNSSSDPFIPLDMYVDEEYLGNGVWLVELLGKNIKNIEYPFGQYPYTWKVYESTGTVERIGVDRDYC